MTSLAALTGAEEGGVDMTPEMLTKRATERPFNFADVVDPMPLGFSRLEEGTRLTAAGRRWQVRLGQGHDALSRFRPNGFTAIERARDRGGRDPRHFGNVRHLKFALVHF